MSQQTNDQTRSMAPIACPDWECPRPENLRCLRLNQSECWFSCSPSPNGVGRRREARLGPLRDGSVIAESECFEKNVNLRRRRSVASCSMFFQHVIVNFLISSCSRSLSSIRRVVHNCSWTHDVSEPRSPLPRRSSFGRPYRQRWANRNHEVVCRDYKWG